ncbi:MAG: 3-isopropylmalate dehydratase large subunit [Nitrospirae bacterium]|nr:3-isopropylmalate dehydratase large subunit [Nitrospirota bacterium]
MGMTVTEKILSAHCSRESVRPDEFIEVRVDLAMGNDITAPIAIRTLQKNGLDGVWDRSKVALVMSHFVPAKDIASAEQAHITRSFARSHDLPLFFDEGQGGIEHSLLPELGLVVPGDVVIGADSHSCTYGALGIFSTGVGSTDLAAVLATGEFWMKVPASMKFVYNGSLPPWVMGKDLILYTIGKIGDDGARYRALEFTGPAIRSLSIEGRLTMSNMAIEAGGKSGIIAADAQTIRYVEPRTDRKFKIYESDPDAEYVSVHEWDVSTLEPIVSCPSLPSRARSVGEVRGQRVTYAFLGSCTNARIEDLRLAARILRGKKIARGMRLMVIPATVNIYKQALREGLIEVFAEAGASISTATCGPCLGGHMGVLGSEDVCISSSNRNFPGRMGHKDAKVYLANPAVVAATALTGVITHPADVAPWSEN